MQRIGETADPNSLASISQRAQILEMQAIADSEFDAKVPAPRRSAKVLEPFTGPTRLALAALLLVGVTALMRLNGRRYR